MRKSMRLVEAIDRGLDIFTLLGVDKETKTLKKKKTQVTIKEVVHVIIREEEELEVPIFLTDDYRAFKRYMERIGLEPSVSLYNYLTHRGA